MDFLKLIGDSTKYTFHSHTEFCDGRAQMEAFAREAVAQCFTHYGFTPHSPIPIESSCNMHRDKVPTYLNEVERIKEEYGNRVSFYAGMEVDYLGDSWGPSIEYFQSLPLDYMIGSVHFIPDQSGQQVDIDGNFESFKRKMSLHFNNDIRYVVETFYAQSIKMVEAGGFDIIGHFDKIGHNSSHFHPGIENEDWYQSLASQLVDKIIESGVTVELNTKAQKDHHRFFPSNVLLKRIIESNVPLIVNSDAHVPALINAKRDMALELIERIKIDLKK